MKVLWLCNIMLPVIARRLGKEASNKEGWVSGLARTLLAHQRENGISLAVAFPMSKEEFPKGQEIYCQEIRLDAGDLAEEADLWPDALLGASFSCYGFPEDMRCPEKYDGNLEHVLGKIVHIVEPDIIHCFGTEYPHTLAMCRIYPKKERLLVGMQGLCTRIAQAYRADLPEKAVRRVTLRDLLRRDSLGQQQEKFVRRGEMEREIVGLAGNVTGRTEWDRAHVSEWNPQAHYYSMNETLRPQFYGPVWEEGKCQAHSIFLSQGDYPLKGLHYMLLALPDILERYPDARVYVAGSSLVEYGTLRQKLKISAYGRYLRELLEQLGIKDRVAFLGRLTAEQMRDRYLASSLFVCCSSVENSPNSLGEAMLLGMPCVSADVGGISSIFTGGKDGILYRGFSAPADGDGDMPGGDRPEEGRTGDGGLRGVSGRLAAAVLEMWEDSCKRAEYCANARKHALETHDRDRNYGKLVEIYGKIL